MAGIQIEQQQTPPALPVSLATIKNHLRVPPSVGIIDDDLITIYAEAATELVEEFTTRITVNKRFIQSLDSFPYFTDSMMSQMAYPPAYYSLPRYSTTLWNYSQMIKLFYSPLLRGDLWIEYTDTTNTVQKLYPMLENWSAAVDYFVGDEIEDTNGNIQEVTAVAEPAPSSDEEEEVESGATQPTWNATVGGTTTDGPLTWTNQGAAPASGFFYDRISEPPRLFPAPAGAFWPPVLYVPNAVRIHFGAGYGTDGKAVFATQKTAILQLVGNWYENREPVTSDNLKEIPWHLKNLLWSKRIIDFAPTRG